MITLSTISGAFVKAGSRILKVFQYGIKTADECSPFGDDSSPLEGMTAIYAETGEIGEPVIIGYMNERQLAAPGEKRIYSLKDNGDISFYAWLKNDGTMQLGGTADNLVRYAPLNAGLSSHNSQVVAELNKIAVAISSLGGTYVPGLVGMDVSGSKIVEIKTL
jgi:hypothetical protein